ncbi:MAG: YHS domain-containing (seleno)protein [Albidovulum sp.]
MTKPLKQLILAPALAMALATAALAPAAFAGEYDVNVTTTGLALRGYDPVSYFAEGGPVPGAFDITAEYEGATYRFASQEHADMFKADPAKYLPQFGGYCAFGAAMGKKFDGDPTVWKVVDGKLYLNLAKPVQAKWDADQAGLISQAAMKWDGIKDTPAAELNQ